MHAQGVVDAQAVVNGKLMKLIRGVVVLQVVSANNLSGLFCEPQDVAAAEPFGIPDAGFEFVDRSLGQARAEKEET